MLFSKKQIDALMVAFVAITLASQAQANLCTKISTCARNTATWVANFAQAQATRSDSRVARFVVPRETRTHTAGSLFKHEVEAIFYKPLRWGERETKVHNKPYEILSGSYDMRTVYNFRRLIALGGCIGGLTTLYATYKLGKKVGSEDGYNAGSKELWDSVTAHYDIDAAPMRALVCFSTGRSVVSVAPLAKARLRKLQEELSSQKPLDLKPTGLFARLDSWIQKKTKPQ